MKKKEKQGLIILIMVAILIIAIIWFATRPKENKENQGNNKPTTVVSSQNAAEGEFTKVESNGTVVNTSEKLKEEKNAQGFEISDIQYKEVNGETILTARVTNMTGSEQKSFWAEIVLLDKAGKELGRIPVEIAETQKGESIRIEASITERYANAYDFKLEK